MKGTNGVTAPHAPTAAQAARRDALAEELRARGWSPGVCQLAARAS